MNYLAPAFGVIFMFSYMTFIMVEQRKEIKHWKHEAQIAVVHHNAINRDLTLCVADNEFLRNGVENLIAVSSNGNVIKAIGRSELPKLVLDTSVH